MGSVDTDPRLASVLTICFTRNLTVSPQELRNYLTQTQDFDGLYNHFLRGGDWRDGQPWVEDQGLPGLRDIPVPPQDEDMSEVPEVPSGSQNQPAPAGDSETKKAEDIDLSDLVPFGQRINRHPSPANSFLDQWDSVNPGSTPFVATKPNVIWTAHEMAQRIGQGIKTRTDPDEFKMIKMLTGLSTEKRDEGIPEALYLLETGETLSGPRMRDNLKSSVSVLEI